MIGEMNSMELAILGTILFFTIKGTLSLLGIIWTGKKIKKYIRRRNAK